MTVRFERNTSTLALGDCRSFRSKAESELLPGFANAIVKAEKVHPRDTRTRGQCRCQMKSVKCADRLRGKPMSRSVNNVRTESQHLPMRRRRIQMRPAIGSSGFIDLPQGDRADQHAIALEQREIGGHHQLRMTQHLANAVTGLFSEQPRQHGA